VDAYGREEQALGRYCYLENKIRFPFQAKCVVAKVDSPLLEGETFEVHRMAPEEACFSDVFVLIIWHGCNVAVLLSQLTPLNADKSTAQAIGDWHYWVRARLLLLSCPHFGAQSAHGSRKLTILAPGYPRDPWARAGKASCLLPLARKNRRYRC
jgi:hypothetical protein